MPDFIVFIKRLEPNAEAILIRSSDSQCQLLLSDHLTHVARFLSVLRTESVLLLLDRYSVRRLSADCYYYFSLCLCSCYREEFREALEKKSNNFLIVCFSMTYAQ